MQAANNLQVNISYKQILSIALPIAASIFVPQLNFIINNIFLAQLGESTLAIAGITGVYYLIFAVMGHGLNNGLQALISRRAGEQKIGSIGILFTQGIYISVFMAIAGILLTYVVAPFILKQSIHDAIAYEKSMLFLKIRIWGLPFLYVYQIRNALLVGTNNTKFLVIGTLADAVANVLLDYGLIFGNFGLPKLGFNGAAYASIGAEITGLVVIFLVMKWQGITKQLQLFKHTAVEMQEVKLILVQSAPLILQFAISIISWEFFYILIEHHGVEALAVSNVMRNVFGFFGCVAWAFAATSNSMVSNVIGQGKTEWVMPLIKKILILSTGFCVLACVIINIFPHAVLSIYSQGETFIAAGIPVLRVVSIALVVMSIATIWLNAVVGTGNSRLNLYTEMATITVYCIYVYVVLEYLQLSIVWGWCSELIYWAMMFTPSFIYIRSNKWKGIKI